MHVFSCLIHVIFDLRLDRFAEVPVKCHSETTMKGPISGFRDLTKICDKMSCRLMNIGHMCYTTFHYHDVSGTAGTSMRCYTNILVYHRPRQPADAGRTTCLSHVSLVIDALIVILARVPKLHNQEKEIEMKRQDNYILICVFLSPWYPLIMIYM